MEEERKQPLVQIAIENVDKYKLNDSDHLRVSTQSKINPEMPPRELKWFVKHIFGTITVILVYLFFVKIYAVTVFYCLYPFTNPFIDILHLILFTVLALLALWSHFVSMTQQPGILPLNYTALNEHNITVKFAKLFDERDLQHIGPVYRRLRRSGEDAKAEELIQDQKRQSVYLKVKPKIASEMMVDNTETT